MLLDVLNHQVGPGKMADAGRAMRIVHGVGHIAHQGDVLAQPHHLPYSKGTPEHAHVQMHAAEDHVFDPSLGEQVPGLLAVVGHRIPLGDLHGGDLPCPRLADGALDRTVAAHVRIVDWQRRLPLCIGPAPGGAPTFRGRQRHGRGHKRRGGGPLSLRRIPIERGNAAWRVDNAHAPAVRGAEDLVHGHGQLGYAARGRLAPVVVPHVADDDRGLLRVPGGLLLCYRPLAGIRRLRPTAKVQAQSVLGASRRLRRNKTRQTQSPRTTRTAVVSSSDLPRVGLVALELE